MKKVFLGIALASITTTSLFAVVACSTKEHNVLINTHAQLKNSVNVDENLIPAVQNYQNDQTEENFKTILDLFVEPLNINYRPATKVRFESDKSTLHIVQQVSTSEREIINHLIKVDWNELRFDETQTTFAENPVEKVNQNHYILTVPHGFEIADQDLIEMFYTTRETAIEIKKNSYQPDKDGWHNVLVSTKNSIGKEEIVTLTIKVAPQAVLTLRNLFAAIDLPTEISANGDLESQAEGYFLRKEDIALIVEFITDIYPITDFPGAPLISNLNGSAIGALFNLISPSAKPQAPTEWLPGMEDWTYSEQWWQYLPMEAFKKNLIDIIAIIDTDRGFMKFGYIYGSPELVVVQWKTHEGWLDGGVGLPLNPIT